MTYHLIPQGYGLATDRTPIPAKGKVLLTFDGDFADSVCVNGHFYPIVGKTAEIDTALLEGENTVSAYALKTGRRYACDSLLLSEEGGYLIPATPHEEARLLTLSLSLAEAERRIAALEEDVRTLTARTAPTPFSFGGNYEV